MPLNWRAALSAVLLFGTTPAIAQMSPPDPMQAPLGTSMGRDGSGTSWLPDESPVYAWHATAGSWLFMFHVNSFVHYLRDGSDRGSSQFGSTNWAMGMARHALAGGHVTLRTMLSAEPQTVGRCGYPDLLATGEFCNGLPLHDRQHPHDLFMELAADYQRAVTNNLAVEIYGGPAGEPALGPVAFPHRVSAMLNPFAPITHHWLDATHIAFGVATAGLYSQRWKVEGSLFNGREPDEYRYGIDLNRLDSYSGRAWFLPDAHWAFQASVGRLNEALTSLTRSTASVAYQRTFGAERALTAFVAWGANFEEGKTTHGLIAEANLAFRERDALFGRAELNGKTGDDLAIPTTRTYALGKLAIGYSRSFGTLLGVAPGIGASASLSLMPASLRPYYGTTAAPGLAILVSVRPPRMEMRRHGEHDMMRMP